MRQAFCYSFFTWVVVGAVVKVPAVWQVIVLGSDESFFVCKSEWKSKYSINKKDRALSFFRKSL